MANGLTPAPVNDLGPAITVDDGTLPRIESPPPGPIGLDAKNASPKSSSTSMADQIVAFARHRMGQRLGDGECFALANQALRNAGAKSAGDFGTVVPDADYVWGASINLGSLQPGDVIQLRDYRYDREVETTKPDGSKSIVTDFKECPHHTAIVERVGGHGAVTVLEQNMPRGAPVTRGLLFFTSGTFTNGNQSTTIGLQGTFWFYRPQAR